MSTRDALNYLNTSKRAKCATCPAFEETGYIKGIGDSPTDIVFLADAPPAYIKDYGYTPFSGKAGEFLKRVVKSIVKSNSTKYSNVKKYYTYSTQCTVYKSNADIVNHCSQFVRTEIDMMKPKVIVALGANAMRSMGITTPVKKSRGFVQHIHIGTNRYILICTYAASAMLNRDNYGLLGIFKTDIQKALDLCSKDVIELETIDQLTKDYVQPKNIVDVKQFCEEITDYFQTCDPSQRLMGADTETTRLEMYAPGARCIAASFSWAPRKAGTILLDHRDNPYDPVEARKHVQQLLALDVPKVFHNYKFDYQVLELCMCMKVANVKFDTMLGEHLLDENKKGYYDLKEIVGNYVAAYKGYEADLWENLRKNPHEAAFAKQKQDIAAFTAAIKRMPSIKAMRDNCIIGENYKDLDIYKELRKAKADKKKASEGFKELTATYKEFKETVKNLTFEDVPVDTMIKYAAVDADVTRQIAYKQLAKMAKEKGLTNVMASVSIPASRTLGRMSFIGFRVDLDYLTEVELGLDKKIEDAKTTMYDLVGRVFNPNSTADIANIITMELGLTLTEKTAKTGQFSITKDVMEALYATTNSDFIKQFMEYSTAHKARNTFCSGIRRLCSIDGKIHTNFNLNGTATGRLSSSSINLQNLPKELGGYNIKKIFIPDEKGDEVFDADYSAAEVRVLTAYAKDAALVKAIRSGKCIHSYMTSEIYDIPYEEIFTRSKLKDSDPSRYKYLDNLRTATKRAVFLTFYGGGPDALMTQLAPNRPDITREECERIMDLLLVGFPVIKKYMSTIEFKIGKDKFVTSKFGRRRRFDMANYVWKAKNSAFREGVNMPIQSTSSDIVLSQLVEVDEMSRDPEYDKLGVKMRLTVHDSMVGTVKKGNREALSAFLQKYAVDRVAEKFTFLPVPFAMEAEAGPSYGECKTSIL